jgi:cytochrome c-type biogenesis protein
MLPIYFFYLAGVSSEADITRSKLLINSIGFVLGFTIIFVMLGATATALGSFLKENIDLFQKISGIIMIVFGLNFMGILRLNFLNYEKRFDYNVRKLNFIKSLIFGIVFAFGWTPCVGVFLASALLMAGNSDSVMQGISLLLLYSAGLGVPFIISSIIFDTVRTAFRQIQKYNRMISISSGLVLIFAGIFVLTNNLTL